MAEKIVDSQNNIIIEECDNIYCFCCKNTNNHPAINSKYTGYIYCCRSNLHDHINCHKSNFHIQSLYQDSLNNYINNQ